jgi:hypothetical protein
LAIKDETRKRLWGRSGNRCALCRQELIRGDADDLPGALVGEEAHIVARSPGGPRYEAVPPDVCDGYENLILLCANDHTEVDSQPVRYTVEHLRVMKHRHELWVASRLHVGTPTDSGHAVAVLMSSGAQVWELMHGAFAYQCGSPDDLTDEDAEVVDGALQTFVDWGEISEDVVGQGFRAIRDRKRAMQEEMEALAARGFVLLGGERQGAWAGGAVTGRIAVLQVVRPDELDALQMPAARTTGQ